MSTNLAFPLADLPGLPGKVQQEVIYWIETLRVFHALIDGGMNIKAAAEQLAVEKGTTQGTLIQKYYAYKKHKWKGLVNKARSPVFREDGLPIPFIAYWQGLMLGHQRDTTGKAAYDVLIRQWRAWKRGEIENAIPGYATPPSSQTYCPFPVGWSLQNLMKHAPSLYSRRLRRQGSKEAKKMLPAVRTTRVGMQFLEMVMFDDQLHDVFVNIFGSRGEVINKTMTRPLSFNAIDVLTACDFARGYKPVIFDKENESKKVLNQMDFFYFMLYFLTEFGWRMDEVGTTVVMEHGTASLGDDLCRRIERASEGQVKFQVSGILGEPFLANLLWEGQPSGNPNFKALREGWFRMFRERSAALPGPTGMNPVKSPQETYGLRKFVERYLRAYEKLPPARRNLLAFPILNFAQYVPLAEDIAELINQRTDHEIEGFEELNFVSHEVRLNLQSDQWLSLQDIAGLDPTPQALAMQLMTQEGYGRSRRFSPREAFEMLRADAPLKKLTPHMWNIVIPAEHAHPTTVTKRHEIIIRDKSASLIYPAEVRNDKGFRMALDAGTKVRVYANPFFPSVILVCAENNQAIGVSYLLDRPCRSDLAGMAEVYGKVKSLKGLLEREPKRQAEGLAQARLEMKEHNQRVIKGEAITPEEHASAAKMGEAEGLWNGENAEEEIAPEVTEEKDENWIGF